MKVLILASTLLLSVASWAQQTPVGTISGTVFDESGNPLEGATAYAMNEEGNSGLLPQAVTDRNGHFVIQKLRLGRYWVSASKEAAGYPPTRDAFYSGFDSLFPEVTLDEDNPAEMVSVRLTKRGGWLRGSVRDSATGKFIQSCAMLQWKTD